jgi:hypothetical protein
MRRARRGPGVTGPLDSRTAYFWKQSSWGGSLLGSCAPARRANAGPGGHGHDGKPKDKKPPPGKPRPSPTAPAMP